MTRVFFSNTEISDCGVGILVEGEAELHGEGLKLLRNQIAVIVRNVPAELIEEVAKEHQAGADDRTILGKFGDRLLSYGVNLKEMLSAGADVATILGAL
jgi:hypothetical protein